MNKISRALSPDIETMLKPGDIAVTRGPWIIRIGNRCIYPYTEMFHFFLIAYPIPEEHDWIIFESLASKGGVRIGRLSWYTGRYVRILRPPKHVDVGHSVVNEATKFGRDRYDFGIIFIMVGKLIKWIFCNGFKPIPFYELRTKTNRKVICTELVSQSYQNYYPIVKNCIIPTPAAFKFDIRIGRLEMIRDGKV